MRVFLTGVTGVVGRRLVPLLQNAGHEVTAAVRSSMARAELTTKGRGARRSSSEASACLDRPAIWISRSARVPLAEDLEQEVTFSVRTNASCAS